MKFSVLLPTRNRLEFLRYAVESVTRQDYSDWEIIISDNCSEDDIAGYISSLSEPRIQYFRTQNFVAVTENWNNALKQSSGDYVIMLGDDDGLAPGYFVEMSQLIKRHHQPDFIYTGALLYAYPGVMPSHPEGYLQNYSYACFLNDAEGPIKSPVWIEKKQARYLVEETMKFRIQFGYNMQFALISRNLIDNLKDKGEFFQSLFPDYYAMNVMFLRAKRILADSRPMVIIGITPKSYGFFHFNGREKEGVQLLKGDPASKVDRKLRRIRLPGTHLNDGWLAAVETIRVNYPELDLKVAYWRYRMLQSMHTFHGFHTHKTMSLSDYRQLIRKLRPQEKVAYAILILIFIVLKKILPVTLIKRLRSKLTSQNPIGENWGAEIIVGQYKNMMEVVHDLETQR